MIVDESTATTVKPLIYYGLSYSEETAALNQLNNWSHTFISPGVYDIAIQYEGVRTLLGALSVVAY